MILKKADFLQSGLYSENCRLTFGQKHIRRPGLTKNQDLATPTVPVSNVKGFTVQVKKGKSVYG